MNPNNVNHFSSAAVGIDRGRSIFNRDSKVITTLDSGNLVPLYWDEVLPGDNFKVKANGVCRMTTPFVPVMDNAYLDVYAFFVPNRLIWQHWEEFMGENKSSSDPWLPTTTYTVPQIEFSNLIRNIESSNNCYGDILSYLGVPPFNSPPIDITSVKVNALPVRAYCKIWNEWFRDENTQVPVNFSTGDSDVTYQFNNNLDLSVPSNVTQLSMLNMSAVTGGNLLRVGKFKDYFTSCLPAPQKGNAVTLSLAEFAPVITRSEMHSFNTVPMIFQASDVSDAGVMGTFMSSGANSYTLSAGTGVVYDSNNHPLETSGADYGADMYPKNLWADLSTATAVTVNQLRLAFQTQRYLETLARGGSRYIELLYSLYGVKTSDARLQRSEYLGGKRIPIEMQQVAQTSATEDSDGTSITPQGNVAAFSLTGFSEMLADKFFEEHGIFMIVGCIRPDQTYGQGINRQWFRKDRFDYYAPVFAHLGEQPVLTKEIFYDGSENDDNVFGYQEAWAEYRYKPNIVTGLLQPNAGQPLTQWTYVNDFASAPVLGSQFIMQPKSNIDRTLAVNGGLPHSQFILDLYIENKTTRVMPMYSVPGLIDGVR